MPILLVGCIPFLAIAGTIMAIRNFANRDKITIVPKALINDRISLGSGMLWGALTLIYSLLLSCAFIEMEKDSESIMILCSYLIPLMVTSLFLMMQWNRYIEYHKIYDLIVVYIDGHDVVSKSNIIISGHRYNFLKRCFEDLRSNGIINYIEDEENLYICGDAGNNVKTQTWVCSGCGAPNTQTITPEKSFKCEYCGLGIL